MALFIDSETVGRLLDWNRCIDLLEIISAHEAQNETFVSPKSNSNFRNGSIRILFAADYIMGYGATKAYHTIDLVGTRYLISLIELRTGALLAIVDGRRITDLRTGAASGVIARRVPFNRAVSVGVVGSGHQARAQIECLAAVYDIESVSVFSPTLANREQFAQQLSDKLGISIFPVSSAENAVRGRDIVVAASKARNREPVVLNEWLDGCRLLCAVGNTRPQYLEVDHLCFGSAKLVVVDSLHAYEETGELIQAESDGLIPSTKQSTLSEIVSGAHSVPNEGMVIFKSVGTALQDLALAHFCFESERDNPKAEKIPDLMCSG